MAETFQITREQAEAYEEHFVPALFGQWAPLLVDLAGVGPGDRVLDVACGTGIVARTAAERTGDPSRVTGLDLNPAMVDVAARIAPGIDWQVGDAEVLPFPDARFDRVLCQSALFFFPDARRALAEMARVAARGGSVAVQTYAALADQPAYGPFVDAVVRHAGEATRPLLETYWSWGDLPSLDAALAATGLEVTGTCTRLGTAHFGSVEGVVAVEIDGTPLAGLVTPAQRAALLDDLTERLAAYTTDGGLLELPIRAHLVVAERR